VGRRGRKDPAELPLVKRERFVSQYELPPYDAGVLTSSGRSPTSRGDGETVRVAQGGEQLDHGDFPAT
jgi:hypothetical protein